MTLYVYGMMYFCGRVRMKLIEAHALAQGKQIAAAQDETGNWKMLIVQDGAVRSAPASSPTPKDNGRSQHALVHLPHPRHGERALFMLVGDDVLEMRRARRPEYNCWFVGDRCESQGDITFGTKMDPLFLVLPALEKARCKTPERAGRFCSKEQIFMCWAETCDSAMSLSTVCRVPLLS